MPKTNADYAREYRARKKAAQNKTKKTAKTSTERVRNFRARQKFLKVRATVENAVSSTHDISSTQDAGNNSNAPTQKRYLKRDAIPSCNLPLAESNSFPGATVTNEANENLMAIRTTDDGTPYTYVTVMSNDLEPEISPEKNAENYKHQNDRRYKDDRSVLDRLVIKEECQEPEIKQEPLDEEINQFYQYTDPKKSLTEERTASNSLTIKEEPQEMDIKFETVDLPDLDLHGHFDRLWEPSSVVHSKVARKSTIFHETATQTDEQLNGPKFIDIIKSNKDLNILTGIPNFSVLNTILDVAKVASPSLAKAKGLTLDIADRIIMTFMKLKQDLTYEALSVFFKCNSKKSCKRIILQMLDTLSSALKFAIRWPRKHEDSKNLPDLSYNLSNIRCIINRIDIALRRPKDPLRRITTFSCYKRYHSAKFMTVVTPAGFICFLSKAYGGRTSHRTLFEESNIIKNLEKNDEVMVFKDFSIDDICQNHNIRIVKSLYSQNVEDAQNEANYRIPLNINRRFRQFRIFRRKLTNTLSLKTEEILTILCAVENLNSFTSGITSSINS